MREIINFDSLSSIQDYCRRFVIEKGFDSETPIELMLLLQEEIGELSRVVRKLSGIKTSAKYQDINKEHLGDEIVDCIKYLIILSNKFDIRLSDYFKNKYHQDSNRSWFEFQDNVCENS